MNTNAVGTCRIAPSPWLITRNCRPDSVLFTLLFWRFLPGISHLQQPSPGTLTTNGIGAFVDFTQRAVHHSTGTAGCLPSSASAMPATSALAAALPGQIHSVVALPANQSVACLRFDGVKSWGGHRISFLGYKVAGSISATLLWVKLCRGMMTNPGEKETIAISRMNIKRRVYHGHHSVSLFIGYD